MKRDLLDDWCRGKRKSNTSAVRVAPFMTPLPPIWHEPRAEQEWDFVYIATGEAHKNHACLLQAWRELAKLGIRPRLALTLSERDGALSETVHALREECGAQIFNLGQMSHEEVLMLYMQSSALIFPSLEESFGLPLIEAQHIGLPIIAPELDYVRDVCTPVQTFDPRSPYSIARAVVRFLGNEEPALPIQTPEDFWREFFAEPSAHTHMST